MQWDNALEGYWLAKRRNLSDHTVRDYTVTFNRFGKWIQYGAIEKVTAKEVNAFINHLAEDMDLSPKTQMNAWIALSSLWTWAAAELEIKQVVHQVDKPKCRTRMLQPFTEDEVKRMVTACSVMSAYDPNHDRYTPGRRPTAVRDTAILVILVDTGLRVSELCELRMQDYERKQGRLIVEHGKGDKQRVVFLGNAAQRALWKYLTARGEKADPEPLIASQSGYPLDGPGVRKLILRCGQRAGVAGATPHRFRHTFAINYLRNGGNLLALQAMLGHSSLEMVKRYARLAELDLADAQKRASPADKWRL